MLLVHQAGSVKIGEVVRYTLTYTPTNDRILPTPNHLHLKIKNTSAIPLRAAWVHGPYALHVASYPATFNPHQKEQVEEQKQYGVPEYEPMLKAGGSWQAYLTVPENIRETGADVGKRRHSMQSAHSAGNEKAPSMTWIIEITSQIMFSNSASVNFEVLVGRDERSLDLGFAAVAGHGHGTPGQIKEQQQQPEKERKRARKNGNVQSAGVYSKAVRLVVEDTEALWDKPALPTWEDKAKQESKSMDSAQPSKPKKRKRIHLVVVTHGLHSNLGADMLFLKESIDATVAQARKDKMKRKEDARAAKQQQDTTREKRPMQDSRGNESTDESTAPLSGGQEELNNATEDDDDDEATIVRGFSGNAVRTENGIQYLGKRLAKYILRFTYPDQPFLPVKKKLSRTLTDTFKSDATKARRDGLPSHSGSSIHHPRAQGEDELPYHFTSISFVGHSLGGLIQTYAIAYIHKHSPTFFMQIKPVNFICMASPMLGLSNENPMYVRFALDFGLVGRTGQDLGLTWRPPTMAKSGWNAMLSGFGAAPKDENKPQDPAAKPLLRILPTGPAHQVLRMFRNRTVYSNVVNDGIVPLRTSCLLFLDWRGLGKVDKARRENGLIGTVAEWGWAELTGANSSSLAPNVLSETYAVDTDEEGDEHVLHGEGETVPQPGEDETMEDSKNYTNRLSFEDEGSSKTSEPGSGSSATPKRKQSSQEDKGMLDNLLDFFRPTTTGQKTPPSTSKKTAKAFRRAQTVHHGEEFSDDPAKDNRGTTSNPTMRPHLPHLKASHASRKRPTATRGYSMANEDTGELQAPPKTSIFESAGDILHPPLPSRQWIVDPSCRARTIFHDRIYHPEDIPPPPTKRSGLRLTRTLSSDTSAKNNDASPQSGGSSQHSMGMKVEEKIARAYHRDLSWRKVLVRLEPDAHNNMIVRRMFANAYGWPVIKHLVDTHFSDSYAAMTRDEDEPARERAPPMDTPIAETGEEVIDQTTKRATPRSQTEMREARDELADLHVPRDGIASSYSTRSGRSAHSSTVWDDSYFEVSDGDSDDVDERNFVSKFINPMAPKVPEQAHHGPESQRSQPNIKPTTPTSPSFTDGHRGLVFTSPKTARSMSHTTTSPIFDSSHIESTVLTDHFVEEPPLMSPTSIGLQKNAAEQVRSRPGSSAAEGA